MISNNEVAGNTAVCGYGGGIYLGGPAAPLVWANVIGNDQIRQHTQYVGGGIACVSCRPTVAWNDIVWNEAQYGGGVYCTWSAPTIVSNRVAENYSQGQGGGVTIVSCAADSVRIEDNLIEDNFCDPEGGWEIAPYGGGLWLGHAKGAVVRGNVFRQNWARQGGGLYCSVGPYESPAVIESNVFDQNWATEQGAGAVCGGYENEVCLIEGNTFKSNGVIIEDDPENPIGLCPAHGGALALDGGRPVVVNNVIRDNQAQGTGGGGIYASGCVASIVNNTFAKNQALGLYGHGGAVLAYGEGTNVDLINDVFYKNSAADWYWGSSVACLVSAAGSVLFSGAFSDISGSVAYHYFNITPGTGCWTEQVLGSDEPMFVNEAESDYHLALPGPPYRPMDRGHNPGVGDYSLVPMIDLDGLRRPVDVLPDDDYPDSGGGHNPEAFCDMGAYERQE